MPLRNQPYLPLYVQDYLTDEKLNSCSASSQGVYIKIMCILHKQEEYGTLTLFKQKDKQNTSKVLNFACKFAKLLPFDQETILKALEELIDEGVLIVDEDKIYQKRMVKDGAISEARSKAGKSGGGNPNLFKQTPKQTDKQNTDNENEIENESKDENFVFSDLKELETEMLNSEQWIETTAMSLHTEIDVIKSYIPEYCLEQKAKGKIGSIFKEYKSHFFNWTRIQLEKKKPARNGKEYTYEEAVDLITAKKAFSFSKSFIKKGDSYILK